MGKNAPFLAHLAHAHLAAWGRYEDHLREYRREVQQDFAQRGVVIPKEMINYLPLTHPTFGVSAYWYREQGLKESSIGDRPVYRTKNAETGYREELFLWRLCEALVHLESYRTEVRERFAKFGVRIPDREINSISKYHPRFHSTGTWLEEQRKALENWIEDKPCRGMTEDRVQALEVFPNLLRDSNDELILWNIRVFNHQLPLYRAEMRDKYAKYGFEMDDEYITTIPSTHPLYGYSGVFHAMQKRQLRRYLNGDDVTPKTIAHLHQVFGQDLERAILLTTAQAEEFTLNCKAYPLVWGKLRHNWPTAQYLPRISRKYEGLEIDAHELGNWVDGFLRDWRVYLEAQSAGIASARKGKFPKSRLQNINPEIMEVRISKFQDATGINSPHLPSQAKNWRSTLPRYVRTSLRVAERNASVDVPGDSSEPTIK